MYAPLSARWATALRYPHTVLTSVVHRNLVTGVLTPLSGRDGYVTDGSITEDATKRPRRSLSLTLAPSQAVWDALDTVGGEITVTQAIRYVDMTTERIPMGVFVVDQDSFGYRPDGYISITAPDRWIKIQRNNFGLNRSSVPGNAGWAEVQRLVEACWAGSIPFPGWSQLDESATTKVGQLVWDDGNRDSAIGAILTANSIECYFDRTGKAVLRPVPVLTDTSPSVWTVDAAAAGVFMDGNRTRDRSTVCNAVIVTSSATDVTVAPQEVKDTTPNDEMAVTGALGYVPYYFDSPLIRNSTQALAAGHTILSQQLSVAKQLDITAIPNPALDAGDIILALLPKTDANLQRPTELHILDSVTHPLSFANGQGQELDTRSTRPATDGF